MCTFAAANQTVDVAQLVRVPDCGSVGRGFESHLLPSNLNISQRFVERCFFVR